MFKHLSFLPAAALATTLAFAGPVIAQESVTADTVVATVGKTEITIGHMIAVLDALPEQYQSLPPERLFQGILQQIVEQTLLAEKHEGELSRTNKLSLENQRRSLRAGEVIQTFLTKPVDDAEVTKLYQEQYGSENVNREYNAAHILVATKEEADALIVQLKDDADFATLAQEHSTGPSGPNGGDLGWFGEGVMVPAFFDAVAALDAGGISEPVQTQFGWHIIKLVDTRSIDAPSLDEVRAALSQQIRSQTLDAALTDAREKIGVDESGAEGIDPTVILNYGLLED